MAVNSQSNEAQYQGNGVTVAFSFSYVFFAPSDLVVSLYDTSAAIMVAPAPVLNGAGTYDYQVLGTQDPASGQYLSGATVQFNTAPPGNYQVTLQRVVPLTQNTSYTDNGKFPAKTTEGGLDRLTMAAQQQAAQLARAVASPVADPTIVDFTGRRAVNLAAPINPADGVTYGFLSSFLSTTLGAIGALGSVATYLAGYVGAVVRTVQAKLADIPCVNDFAGVDPTGRTDSTLGLQAAINSGA